MRSLIVIVFLLLSHVALSEQGPGGNFGVSFLGEFTSSNHREVAIGKIESKTGLVFGLGFNFRVLPEVAIEVDLLNIQKNFELVPTASSRESYLLTYLEMPVLVKYMPSKYFHLKGGPYLTGLLIDSVRESGGVANPNKTEFKNDFGVTLGTWIGFPTKKSLVVGIDLRYDLGFADIQADSAPETVLYTRAFVGMLNFSFNFR